MTATNVWPAFDDEVVRAMAKWPDVPCCYGWLRLDMRGNWRIQDEIVRHQRAQAFLSRHFRADDVGRWYVQNGPQQVFVDLDYTPWVYRYQPPKTLMTHTALSCSEIKAALLDDDGNLLVVTTYGVGVVDDRDLSRCEALMMCVDDESVPHALTWGDNQISLATIKRSEVAARFRFDPRPR